MNVTQNQKPRERNVPKIVLSALILFFYCFSLNSQSLSGKYCFENEGNITANCFTFQTSNTFSYKGYPRLGDLGMDYGSGHYTLKKKNLALLFNLTFDHQKGYYKSQRKRSNRDSVYLDITVMNFEKDTIPLGFFVDESEVFQPAIVNEKGKSLLIAKKNQNTSLVKFLATGYEPLKLKLPTDADYNINLYIKESYDNPISEEVWYYRVKEIENDLIVLKQKGSKSQIWRKVKD